MGVLPEPSLVIALVNVAVEMAILEWVAISSSRGSSRPRDWICVSSVFCIGRMQHKGSQVLCVGECRVLATGLPDIFSFDAPHQVVFWWEVLISSEGVEWVESWKNASPIVDRRKEQGIFCGSSGGCVLRSFVVLWQGAEGYVSLERTPYNQERVVLCCGGWEWVGEDWLLLVTRNAIQLD